MGIGKAGRLVFGIGSTNRSGRGSHDLVGALTGEARQPPQRGEVHGGLGPAQLLTEHGLGRKDLSRTAAERLQGQLRTPRGGGQTVQVGGDRVIQVGEAAWLLWTIRSRTSTAPAGSLGITDSQRPHCSASAIASLGGLADRGHRLAPRRRRSRCRLVQSPVPQPISLRDLCTATGGPHPRGPQLGHDSASAPGAHDSRPTRVVNS
jgi:hypothetical protein